MAFSGYQLDAFKQDVYRRIQIAAAVYLIKNTPRGKPPEAHAIDVQQKLKLRWLNSNLFQGEHHSNSCIDNHILRQEQDALKSRLHSVVPQSNYQFLKDSSFILEDTSVAQKQPVSSQAYYEDFNRDRCEVLANANFIQAIIHLKALAETQSTIPIQQYISSVSKMGNRSGIFPSDTCKTATEFAPSNDSGFYNVEECQSSTVNPQGTNSSSVASSMLMYIMSSCNADQLLEKSIQAVLNQLRKLSSGNEIAWTASNLHEAMNQWTGSIYQLAIQVLHAIMGEPTALSDIIETSRDMCFTIIREITEIIIKKDTPNEISYQTKENQIMMVLELSEGSNIWFQTLELIFSSLADLTAKIKKGHEYSNETKSSCSLDKASVHIRHQETQLLDQCFFLLRLLQAFLCSQHMNPKVNRQASKDIKPTPLRAGYRTVAGLWKKHYEIQNEKTVTSSIVTPRLGPTKHDFEHWKKILEDPFHEILHKYPLVSVIIHDCVQKLPSLQLKL